MSIAVYPGSFNPFHQGHIDILIKALKIFDKVVIMVGSNPDKIGTRFTPSKELTRILTWPRVEMVQFDGLLVDAIKPINPAAVIRGLRNGYDLQYEMNQQYWNEDLGLEIPVVYFITDRALGHISSSAIRSIEKVKEYAESNTNP